MLIDVGHCLFLLELNSKRRRFIFGCSFWFKQETLSCAIQDNDNMVKKQKHKKKSKVKTTKSKQKRGNFSLSSLISARSTTKIFACIIFIVVIFQLLLNWTLGNQGERGGNNSKNNKNNNNDYSITLRPSKIKDDIPEKTKLSRAATSFHGIESFSPYKYPILPDYLNVNDYKFPIKVGIVTIQPLIGEAMHFLYDGVVGSDVLQLVEVVSLYDTNKTQKEQQEQIQKQNEQFHPSDAMIWLVDGARVAKLKRTFLTHLLHPSTINAGNTTGSTISSPTSTSTTTKSSSQIPVPSWKVVFLDFSDRFQFQLNKYHKLDIWDESHVRLAVRSIIQGRYYNSTSRRQVVGNVAPNLSTAGGPMLHCPYAVRTDVVSLLTKILADIDRNSTTSLTKTMETTQTSLSATASTKTSTTMSIKSLVKMVQDTERPIDVAHMWQISFKEGKSKYRNEVSRLVRSWNGSNAMLVDRTIVTSIQEQGERGTTGRNSVSEEYLKALLSAKIVVVTQKDDWEDHYRLMESLVCGPLVLADVMLSSPAGLVDGSNILFFQNLTQLQQLTEYYLQNENERKEIAQRGLWTAMSRHRSWHRLEEILFGKVMTSNKL